MGRTKKETEVSVETESKQKRLDLFLKKMEKDFGEGAIMRGNSTPKFHEVISTGSLGLDKALGIGGLPRGRIVEIYGPESSGKTTVAMHVMKEAQLIHPENCVAMIDAEHAYSEEYAHGMGIDNSRVFFSQPDSGEQALELTRKIVESGEFEVVVVDSVAALVPRAELEGEVGDSRMGLQARMMSQALRMLAASVSKSNCVLIFINQLREKIGAYTGGETTTGGNALKFYASIRLDIRRNYAQDSKDKKGGAVVEDGELVGNLTRIKVIKNKVAPPFRKCEFNILYGKGIDTFGEVLLAAVESNIITRAGSWYSYGDMKLGQGFETVKTIMHDNEGLYNEIRDKVHELYIPAEFVPTDSEIANNEKHNRNEEL